MIFVASKRQDLVALNLISKSKYYVYMEKAKRQYYTVTYDKEHVVTRSMEDDTDGCFG